MTDSPSKEAGRALDAMIAERVTLLPRSKWRSRCAVEQHSSDEGLWCYDCRKIIPEAGDEDADPSAFIPPRYSTSIADAMRVVPAMQALGFEFAMHTSASGWTVEVYNRHADGMPMVAEEDCDDSLQLLICRASLAALDADLTVRGAPTPEPSEENP